MVESRAAEQHTESHGNSVAAWTLVSLVMLGSLVACDGTLDVPDIDAILTHGLALRWACAGPFALTELGGGTAGSRAMLERLGPALNGWWGDLSRLELDVPAREAVLEAMARHPAAPCSVDQMHGLMQKTLQVQAFCAHAGT